MGLRGPQPKPTALKVAAGNPGRRQLNEHEPIPPAGEVSPPTWLRPQALVIWNQLAPVLVQMRTLTTADVLAFGRYCQLFARYLELDAFLMSRGPSGTTFTSKGPDNKVKYVHELPQAAEHRRLVEQLIRHEDRFGISPAARSRLHVGVVAAVNASITAQQIKDQEKREFFASGGPIPPVVIGSRDDEGTQNGPTKTDAAPAKKDGRGPRLKVRKPNSIERTGSSGSAAPAPPRQGA